jgi:hypothetical protein
MYDASAVRTASGYVAENASVWRRGGIAARICLERDQHGGSMAGWPVCTGRLARVPTGLRRQTSL